MMRVILTLALSLLTTLAAAQDRDATLASGGELRVLDKLTGAVIDMSLNTGETGVIGFLEVTLVQCRYPAANPSGDAYSEVVVFYRDQDAPVFAGWMFASSPALNAMDHPRYDVWPLRCMTS